jgi:hypothetical protein
MAKKIFISFNFRERGYKNDLLGLFAPSKGVLEATPIFVENDVTAGGEPAIKAEIKRVMDPCSGLIALVGEGSHNSPWIDYEMGYANTLGIPKVAVWHPQSRGGPPNNHQGMRVVGWNSPELAEVVRGWRSR